MAEIRKDGVPEDNEVLGVFLLRIQQIQKSDNVNLDLQWINKNVPVEAVLLQVRTWLRSQERSYYRKFDRTFGDI